MTVGTMSGINAISESVEQQSMATSEIAMNASLDAVGVGQIRENIMGVSHAAETTGTASTQMRGLSLTLESRASELRDEVGRFVEVIRVA